MQHDLERPIYHLAGSRGWINDPNAVLMFDDRLHLFFQHLPKSSVWTFGIEWGHVVSDDMVRWWHMPTALEPTPGHLDADGCFSGCGLLDCDGRPTILYTGVRLRSNPAIGALPAPEDDLGLPFIESQLCAAQADPGDPMLTKWTKLKGVALPAPPQELRPASKLMGWRDPYIFDTPNEANGMTYGLLLGNGMRDRGGCVLLYRSHSLTEGWQYVGMLCAASDTKHGEMFECPVLVAPPRLDVAAPGAATNGSGDDSSMDHVLFVSPDAPINPVLYWVGQYRDNKFDLQNAKGPYKADHGGVLYAVNTFNHPDGRLLLWGWLQEQPERRGSNMQNGDGSHDYAGCLTVPRELYLGRDGRLVQRPLREIDQLHVPSSEVSFGAEKPLPASQVLLLPAALGPACHLRASFTRGSSAEVGIIIQGERPEGICGTTLLYAWEADQLSISQDHNFDAATGTVRHAQADELNDAGIKTAPPPPAQTLGPVHKHVPGDVGVPPGNTLDIEVFIDGSAVELFVSNVGVVLSTRVYRGSSAPQDGNAPQQAGEAGSAEDQNVAAAAAANLGAATLSSQSSRSFSSSSRRPGAASAAAATQRASQQLGSIAEGASSSQAPWLGLVALGGEATVSKVQVWEMAPCWRDKPEVLQPAAAPAAAPEPAAAQEAAAVAGAEEAAAPAVAAARPEESDLVYSCMAPSAATTYRPSHLGRCRACMGLHRHGECPCHRDHDSFDELMACSVPYSMLPLPSA